MRVPEEKIYAGERLKRRMNEGGCAGGGWIILCMYIYAVVAVCKGSRGETFPLGESEISQFTRNSPSGSCMIGSGGRNSLSLKLVQVEIDN